MDARFESGAPRQQVAAEGSFGCAPSRRQQDPTRWSESFVEEELGLYEIQLLH